MPALSGGLPRLLAMAAPGGAPLWGLLAVLLATAAWGVHDSLSRALAERDPGQGVMAKSLLGATATTALALAVGVPLRSAGAALALFAIGATGRGLSLHLCLPAQRAFGAARMGSVFAFAPIIGAAFAVALGDRSAGGLMVLGSAVMLAGVVLHLAESHGHEQKQKTLAQRARPPAGRRSSRPCDGGWSECLSTSSGAPAMSSCACPSARDHMPTRRGPSWRCARAFWRAIVWPRPLPPLSRRRESSRR